MKKRMVEATVNVGKKRVPIGIMNAGQALDMQPQDGMKFSHPDGKPGDAEGLLTRDELEAIVDPKEA